MLSYKQLFASCRDYKVDSFSDHSVLISCISLTLWSKRSPTWRFEYCECFLLMYIGVIDQGSVVKSNCVID